ncbi:MAG: hypothetical protein WBB01_23840 [Phormidesmis sp.]
MPPMPEWFTLKIIGCQLLSRFSITHLPDDADPTRTLPLYADPARYQNQHYDLGSAGYR